MIRYSVLFTLILFSMTCFAQKKKVIYKYKEYEKFDLGDLEIKGSIIAPGDISVKERRRKVFERELLKRDNFDKKIIEEIKFLR
ncbi:MAG: hypothetical protein QF441_00580 [Bacteriovoracaceae bacterium]|nr:hypothetical protein [Halobacteriovoraceae bacterium]MDP7319064.1 hypothetical protein [Bacteriovoracaceae bacterium]